MKTTDACKTVDTQHSVPDTPTTPSDSAATASRGRLVSLDALRGFDMFWIVGASSLVHALKKVSDTGPIKILAQQLSHVQWEGFRFYDLIFPMFVFISGISLVFSLDKTLARQGAAKAIKKVVVRGILLILIGIYFYGGLSKTWSDIRLLGVLQYIGIAGLFGGILYIAARRRESVIAGVCITILLGYWALMEFVPFPDLKLDKKSLQTTVKVVGSADPEIITASAEGKVRGHYAEGYNLSNYVDYRYLPGKKINGAYENQPILGIIGVVAAGLLGILAGLWLRRTDVSDKRKVVGLAAAGIAGVAIGFLWGLQFPVIKKLWSSSFVLVAAGYSSMLLALFYWVIEIRNKKRWCQPFIWIGMNPLTLYLAANIVSFSNLASRFAGGSVQSYLNAHIAKGTGDVLLVIIQLGLIFLFVRFLYVRKIFIRI